MRILLWVTAGFGAAMAMNAYEILPVSWYPAVLILGFFLYRIPKRRKLACICGGMGLGFLWFSLWTALYLQPIEKLDGVTRHLSVAVTRTEVLESGACRGEGWTLLGGRPYRIRILLKDQKPEPGDVVEGMVSLRFVKAQGSYRGHGSQTPGGFLAGTAQGELELKPDGAKALSYAGRLRRSILTRLDRAIPEDAAPFAKALLLGDDNSLDSGTNQALSLSGIRHVVAVSGLHVTILCMLVSWLTLNNRWITFPVTIPLLLVFCAVTGFTPSVTRAALMMTVAMAAPILGRDRDTLTRLAFAVYSMLLGNPMVITSVSFQLSVASVLGLLVLGKPIYNGLARFLPRKKGIQKTILHWLYSSVAISLGALILVTPLTALHFGTVSLISPVTNLFTVWLIPWIFWGILLILAVSLITETGALILGCLLAWPIRFILGMAKLMGAFPLAALYTVSVPVLIWLVMTYGVGYRYLATRDYRPWRFLRISVLGLALALCLSWIPPRVNTLRVTAFPDGSGPCLLLQSRGKSVLVNCGSREQARLAADTLLSQGIHHLDCLIFTGLTGQNTGGAEAFLERISTDRI